MCVVRAAIACIGDAPVSIDHATSSTQRPYTDAMRRRLPPFLLLFALLLTQWLSVAHALEHPALEPEKACAICLFDSGLDSAAPLPTTPLVAHSFGIEAPRAITAGTIAELQRARPRARAPPSFLAA